MPRSPLQGRHEIFLRGLVANHHDRRRVVRTANKFDGAVLYLVLPGAAIRINSARPLDGLEFVKLFFGISIRCFGRVTHRATNFLRHRSGVPIFSTKYKSTQWVGCLIKRRFVRDRRSTYYLISRGVCVTEGQTVSTYAASDSTPFRGVFSSPSDVTGRFCTKWNERKSIWRRSGHADEEVQARA